MAQKRIEFIDLAKGICILLVITVHVTSFNVPVIQSMRMPLYYILSGLFFKDYGGLGQLVKKNLTNS